MSNIKGFVKRYKNNIYQNILENIGDEVDPRDTNEGLTTDPLGDEKLCYL